MGSVTFTRFAEILLLIANVYGILEDVAIHT